MRRKQNWFVAILTGAWSIVNGLAVTLRNAARPRVTENYPASRAVIGPRWRGRLVHVRDAEGRLKCTACLACQKVCPSAALPTIEGDDRKGKERRAKTYIWEAGRCLYCGYCVEACPFDAIALTQEYSIVTRTREELRLGLEQLCPPPSGGEE
jgi:NADH-quinone oxidoreductase subunit I